MPGLFCVIRDGRREPLCARRQGDARKIGLFHRIHQEHGRTLRHSFIQSLYRAERELSRQVIRHGIVPPYAERPSVEALGFRHVFGAYAFGHDAFSREQHDDIVIELRGKFARVGLRHAGGLHILQEIFRRHDEQRLLCEAARQKLLVQAIHEKRLRSAVLALDIVKEYGEALYAHRMNRFQLSQHGLFIRLARPARKTQVKTRRYGEDHLHARSPRLGGKTLQREHLLQRIRLTPLLAMVRIVLRRVDVEIHAVLAQEVQHHAPLGLRPRSAVEALDDAALRPLPLCRPGVLPLRRSKSSIF